MEQVVPTAKLRAALASGKVTPSTLVWRDGMKEPAPAFTIAELSSAAIAARRSAFPPRPKLSSSSGPKSVGPASTPPRAPQLRPPTIPPGARPPLARAPMRTLVGLEPEEMMGSLGLTTKTDMSTSLAGDAPSEASAEATESPAIPPAPRLPLDAETTAVDSGELDRAPAPAPKPSQGRHKTLLGGLAPKAESPSRDTPAPAPASAAQPGAARSQPPPPPRRRAAVAPRRGDAESTTTQTKTSPGASPRPRSIPPPPPRRRSSEAPPADATASATSEAAGAGGEQPVGPGGRRITTLEIEKTETATGSTVALGAQTDAATGDEAPTGGADSDGSTSSLRGLTKTLEMDTKADARRRPSITDDDDDDAPTRQFDKDLAEGHDSRPPSGGPAARSGSDATAASVPPPSAHEELDDDDANPLSARRATVRRDAVEVPLSSLVAASAVWIVGLVAFFFAGRVTGHQAAPRFLPAKSGVTKAYLAHAATRAAPAGAEQLKPCWVTRQPTRWLPSASRSIPFDMRASSDTMELGLAVGEHEALGLSIDPRSGKFEEKLRKKAEREIVRVTPMGQAEGFLVSEEGSPTVLPVGTNPRVFVVLGKDSIGASESVDGEPTSIWSLEGDDTTSAESVLQAGADFFFVMRRGRDVQAGWFDGSRVAKTPLATIPGSGGRGGRPKSGFNGAEVAVAFADKPDDDTPWQIRLGTAPIGRVAESTEVVSIPEGGPGGDVIAPDIVGLADGRWLLMWTEGEAGQRAIRAQTYSPKMEAIGDPIALSPPAGNFGQAVLGTVGGYTTVVFLQRGDDDYELWGAVLQCGS